MANQFAARKDGDYKVISMAPDVCLTPIGSSQVPVPYPIIISLNSSNNESQNVYFNGNPAFILSSDSVKTQGDEAGTGKGVKSGTKGAKAEPKDHSSSFKVNGSPVIRVNDQFYMNNKNTIGILVHCPPPPTNSIQDEGVVEPIEIEELDFFEQLNQRLDNALETASNKLNEAYNYAVELDEEYKIVTRAEGLVTGAFGVVEIVGGAAAIIFPEPATTAGGVLLVANGSDNTWSGFSQAWSGESQQTLLEKGVGKAANMMGVPEETAQLAMAGAAILSNPTKIATKGDDVIETAWDIGKTQQKVDKIDAPKNSKATPNQEPKEKDASPKKEEGSDGGKVKGKSVNKMDVKCFDQKNKQSRKDKAAELDRQLADQQNGLNNMSVDEYLEGRGAFLGRNPCNLDQKVPQVKRDPKVAKDSRSRETTRRQEKKASEYKRNPSLFDQKKAQHGLTSEKAVQNKLKEFGMMEDAKNQAWSKETIIRNVTAMADSQHEMRSLAALHNPDMVAGGLDKITGFGDKNINSMIGASWSSGKENSRVSLLDKQACKEANEKGNGSKKMNVELVRCANKRNKS
ncbi:PAAR-like domain-containing protein [Vibrio mimicus]